MITDIVTLLYCPYLVNAILTWWNGSTTKYVYPWWLVISPFRMPYFHLKTFAMLCSSSEKGSGDYSILCWLYQVNHISILNKPMTLLEHSHVGVVAKV